MFVAASDGYAKRISSCGVFACLHEFTRNQIIDDDVLNLVMVIDESMEHSEDFRKGFTMVWSGMMNGVGQSLKQKIPLLVSTGNHNFSKQVGYCASEAWIEVFSLVDFSWQSYSTCFRELGRT